MATPLRLTSQDISLLACPKCGSRVAHRTASEIICEDRTCGMVYPILDGIPVLLDDERSVFTIAEVEAHTKPLLNPIHSELEAGSSSVKRKLINLAHKVVPRLESNRVAGRNFRRFADFVSQKEGKAKVLIVGGRVLGAGMEAIVDDARLSFVETDVSHGPRTQLICDAHNLPFQDEVYDGVIIQAVLEHVLDPYSCVSELYRVLKPGGIVYAETPFIQQVHEGRYDFTRFTHRGHRRLFRHFAEISSGAVGGPGIALAWSWRYFLMSFAGTRTTRSLMTLVARLTAFWLKYLDPFLLKRPFSMDAVSSVYFLGRKSDHVLTDRELIQLY